LDILDLVVYVIYPVLLVYRGDNILVQSSHYIRTDLMMDEKILLAL